MSDSFEIPSDYRTIQQVVTEKIRKGILDGTFKPDERLNQMDLAERLNVSRIPTREALRTLEGEGLVKFYPHRGAIVSTMSPDEIEEVYEIRILLEINAVQRAAKRINEDELEKVRELQKEMVKTKDIDHWVRLNDLFHEALYRPSGWTRLMSVIETLRNMTTPYVRLFISDQFDRDAANIEHQEIVGAMEDRDIAALKAFLRRHLSHSCQGILSYLNKAAKQDKPSRDKGRSTSS